MPCGLTRAMTLSRFHGRSSCLFLLNKSSLAPSEPAKICVRAFFPILAFVHHQQEPESMRGPEADHVQPAIFAIDN